MHALVVRLARNSIDRCDFLTVPGYDGPNCNRLTHSHDPILVLNAFSTTIKLDYNFFLSVQHQCLN